MHIATPKDWRRAGKLQFRQILGDINWKKDDFGFHVIVGTHPPKRFAIQNGDEILVDPIYMPDGVMKSRMPTRLRTVADLSDLVYASLPKPLRAHVCRTLGNMRRDNLNNLSQFLRAYPPQAMLKYRGFGVRQMEGLTTVLRQHSYSNAAIPIWLSKVPHRQRRDVGISKETLRFIRRERTATREYVQAFTASISAQLTQLQAQCHTFDNEIRALGVIVHAIEVRTRNGTV